MAKKKKEDFDIASLNKKQYIENNYLKEDESLPEKEIRQKRTVSVLFMCFILFSVSVVLYVLYFYKNDTDNTINIAASPTATPESTVDIGHADRFDILATPEPRQVLSKYDEYIDKYPDLVGWISIDNIKVDNPVVQNSDPSVMHKYIDLGPDQKPSQHGAIFLDIRNSIDASDKHSIIYGHNMKDGTMFGQLNKYLDRSFYLDHLIIRYDTLYQELEWEVFNVFITNTDFYYIQTYFQSDEEFVNLMTQCIYKSYYNDNKTVISPDDRVLTLSTCTNKVDDGRLVIQARLITPLDEPESPEQNTSITNP
ncbi:MAG: class B sortase [Eubacteriales bacterium]